MLYSISPEDLSIEKPDIYLDCKKDNIGITIGDIIAKTYSIFTELKPDAVLVDGQNTGFTGSLSAPLVPTYLGKRSDGYQDQPWIGNLSPIHIYNRALSANEVLHNYNALKGRFT